MCVLTKMVSVRPTLTRGPREQNKQEMDQNNREGMEQRQHLKFPNGFQRLITAPEVELL